MVRLKHYDNEGTARFVTFGCYRNQPFLSDDNAKIVFLELVAHSSAAGSFEKHNPVETARSGLVSTYKNGGFEADPPY